MTVETRRCPLAVEETPAGGGRSAFGGLWEAASARRAPSATSHAPTGRHHDDSVARIERGEIDPRGDDVASDGGGRRASQGPPPPASPLVFVSCRLTR